MEGLIIGLLLILGAGVGIGGMVVLLTLLSEMNSDE
jgi:hypothetical protein